MQKVINNLNKNDELYKIEYIIDNPIFFNIFNEYLNQFLTKIKIKIEEIKNNPKSFSKPQSLLYTYHEYLSDLYNNLQQCKFIQSEKNKKEVQYFIKNIDTVKRDRIIINMV